MERVIIRCILAGLAGADGGEGGEEFWEFSGIFGELFDELVGAVGDV